MKTIELFRYIIDFYIKIEKKIETKNRKLNKQKHTFTYK